MTKKITTVAELLAALDIPLPTGCSGVVVAQLDGGVVLQARHGRGMDHQPNLNVIFEYHFPQVGDEDCVRVRRAIRSLYSLTDQELNELLDDSPAHLSELPAAPKHEAASEWSAYS